MDRGMVMFILFSAVIVGAFLLIVLGMFWPSGG